MGLRIGIAVALAALAAPAAGGVTRPPAAPGAVLVGVTSERLPVRLDVSKDGRRVRSFTLAVQPVPCVDGGSISLGDGTRIQLDAVIQRDGRFSWHDGDFRISGRFSSPRAASGLIRPTFQDFQCEGYPIAWRAIVRRKA